MKHLRSFFLTGLPEAGVIFLAMAQVYLINSGWGITVLGQVAVLVAICAIARALGFPNTQEAVMRFFRQARDKGQDDEAVFVVLLGLVLDMILIGLISTTTWFAWGIFAPVFEIETGTGFEIALFFSCQILLQMRGPFLGISYAEKRIAATALTGFFDPLIRVIALITIMLLVSDLNLQHIAIAYIMGAASSLALVALCTFDLVLGRRPSGDQELVFKYLRFAGATYLSNIFKASRGRFDTLILAAFTNVQDVGVYEILKKFSAPLNALVRPLQIIYSKDLISAIDASRTSSLDRLISKSAIIVLCVNLPILVIIYLCLDPLFKLFDLSLTRSSLIALGLLMIIKVINQLMWWARSFGLMVSARTVILWNALSTAGAILLPVALLGLTQMSPLPALCLGTVVGTAPSWVMPIILYRRFRSDSHSQS